MRFVSLIVCMMLAGTSYAEEDWWYGVIPYNSAGDNCVTNRLEDLGMTIHAHVGDLVNLQHMMKDYFEVEAKKRGGNVVLDYEISYQRLENDPVLGILHAQGSAAKVKCK